MKCNIKVTLVGVAATLQQFYKMSFHQHIDAIIKFLIMIIDYNIFLQFFIAKWIKIETN